MADALRAAGEVIGGGGVPLSQASHTPVVRLRHSPTMQPPHLLQHPLPRSRHSPIAHGAGWLGGGQQALHAHSGAAGVVPSQHFRQLISVTTLL